MSAPGASGPRPGRIGARDERTAPDLSSIARRIPASGGRPDRRALRGARGRPRGEPEGSASSLPGVDAIVADPTVAVGPELLDAAGPGLRLVANFAVGYDNIDLEACRDRGVIATNTPDVLTDATAELALALTLAAARGLPAAERRLRAGEWAGFDTTGDLGIELSGATFGIVGMGRIGRRYAELVRADGGLDPLRGPRSEARRRGALGAVRAELEELLGALRRRQHPRRRARRDRRHDRPRRARPDATGRDPRQHRAGLAGRLGGARGRARRGLDRAPPASTSTRRSRRCRRTLLAAPNCVLLPHIGSATVTARDAMASLVADSVLAVLDGREPPNRIA